MNRKSFVYKSWDELLSEAEALKISLPFGDASALGLPLTFGGKPIPNRMLAQPIEGFDALSDGAPGERTIGRYCDLARGGFGTLWMESISVTEEGRSNPYQLWLHEGNAGAFEDMVKTIRESAEGPVFLVAQLTHSGRYSNPTGNPSPVTAIENPHIPKENARIITDDEIRRLETDYTKAVGLAALAGFDAVDIRACHGYLINELFAAYERRGEYGGSFENRTRMLMNIVRQALEIESISVGVRLNMYDGIPYPYGWGVNPETGEMDLSEPLRLVEMLSGAGVRLLNISNGIGAVSPFVIRPYDTGGPEPGEHQLQGIDRMLQSAREAKLHAGEALVVASGFSWLREYAPAVAAGGIEQGWFDLAGWGRQSIAWPSFADQVLKGRSIPREGCCTTCCGCTNLIKKSGKMLYCVMRNRLETAR